MLIEKKKLCIKIVQIIQRNGGKWRIHEEQIISRKATAILWTLNKYNNFNKYK